MSSNSSNSQLSISPDVIGKLFDWVWKHKHSQHDTDEAHEDEPNRFGTSALPPGASGEFARMQCTYDAKRVCAALVEMFASEAARRAATTAADEGAAFVDQSHLEHVLPELLLDFR